MPVFNDIEDESEGVMERVKISIGITGYTDLSSLNFSDDSFVSGACFYLRVNRSMDMCVVVWLCRYMGVYIHGYMDV